MSISAIAIAPAAAPQHVADLRPVADAAAMRRETDPALPVAAPPATSFAALAFPPVTPPSPVTKAEVGKTLLAADSGADDRKLKPWGVTMLPNSEARDQAARQQEAKEQRAARERSTGETSSRDRPATTVPASVAATSGQPRAETARTAQSPSTVVDRNPSATDVAADRPTLSHDPAEPVRTPPSLPKDDGTAR